MEVKIIKTDWFLSQEDFEGTVTFQLTESHQLDAFSYGVEFSKDEIADIELSMLEFPMEWENHFKNNPRKEKKLIKSTEPWGYEGYGQVISINPVIIDFGIIQLDSGNWTNDPSVIGEYIYWKIDRLDIAKREFRV